jgi:hypothetical protein
MGLASSVTRVAATLTGTLIAASGLLAPLHSARSGTVCDSGKMLAP